jgi:GntR family transcriptional regulator
MSSLAELIGPLDAKSAGPLYRKLQDGLRSAIQRSLLRPNEALPAERDLAAEFEVSRITIRKALDALVGEGLLTRRQGAGTFVASRVEKQFSKLTSFSEDMAARGRAVRSQWLLREAGSVRPDESLTLGLGPGTGVYRFNRIRFADDMPMALEYSTVSGFALSGPDAVGNSLYEALEKAGHRPVRALQRLRAVLVGSEQAGLLGIEAGEAALYIERRGFLEDGRVVEATQSWYRGDAYDFVAELNMQA